MQILCFVIFYGKIEKMRLKRNSQDKLSQTLQIFKNQVNSFIDD